VYTPRCSLSYVTSYFDCHAKFDQGKVASQATFWLPKMVSPVHYWQTKSRPTLGQIQLAKSGLIHFGRDSACDWSIFGRLNYKSGAGEIDVGPAK